MPLKRKRQKHHPGGCGLPVTPVEEALKIVAPTTPEGWALEARKRKQDANDILAARGPGGLARAIITEGINHCVFRRDTPVVSLRMLRRYYPNLRKPIIHGLLRRGEIMNIIAAPKSAKSMLAGNLTMATISGQKFLGKFQCERGRVLVVDNELHPETIVHRNNALCKAFKIRPEQAEQLIDYMPLRGGLVDLPGLEKCFEGTKSGFYSIIILDAFYKLFPMGVDENDNADMANLYNLIDKYADCLDSAFILIHHTSKGLQTERAVTDVGAGAGSQSRAADTHLILRQHEDEGVFIIDAAVRSWPPVAAFCAKFKYPLWELDESAKPENLKGKRTKAEEAKLTKAEETAEDNAKLEKLLTSITNPMTRYQIIELSESMKLHKPLNDNDSKYLIKRWVETGRAVEAEPRHGPIGAKYLYCANSTPPPATVADIPPTAPQGDSSGVDEALPPDLPEQLPRDSA